jgi:hypothetical protein
MHLDTAALILDLQLLLKISNVVSRVIIRPEKLVAQKIHNGLFFLGKNGGKIY